MKDKEVNYLEKKIKRKDKLDKFDRKKSLRSSNKKTIDIDYDDDLDRNLLNVDSEMRLRKSEPKKKKRLNSNDREPIE